MSPPALSRLERRALGLLLLATLAVKAIVLAQLYDHPLLQPRGGLDTAYYVDLARRAAEGDLRLGPEPYFVAPLYVYFLALVFSVTGGSLLAARCVQIVLGTIAVGLLHRTARHWFGAKPAWIAAALAMGTGVFTFNEALILQSALDPFLTALTLHLVTRAAATGRPRAFVAAGLALGLLALNRPNALAYAFVLALLLPLLKGLRAGLRASAALVGGLVLAVAPATLRNVAVSGELVLISSHGGLNFYIGNNAEADGTYHSVPGITPSIEGQARHAGKVAEAALGRALGAGEVSDYFYAKAWAWIREHPRQALALLLRKLAYLLNATDLSLNYSYAYYSRDEPTLLRALVIGPLLVIPLGLVGVGARLLRGPKDGFGAWAAFVPAYGLSVAAFFVSSRYRLPLLVPLCAGAGGAVDALHTALRGRQVKVLAAYAAALAPLVALASWNFGLDDGRSDERTAMIVHQIGEGRLEGARRLLGRAAAEHPLPGVLYFRAGRAFQGRGELLDAIALFERALSHDPGQAEIRFSLGQCLLDSGRAAEAAPHLRAAYEAGVRPDVAVFGLARALAASGKPREAAEVLRRLALPPTTDAASYLALGTLALELGEAALARGFLSEGVARAPGTAAAREKHAIALSLLGRPAEALREIEEAVRLDPTSPSAHLNRAVLLAEAGRYTEAGEAARRSLALRPDYPQARQLLAHLEERAGQAAPAGRGRKGTR